MVACAGCPDGDPEAQCGGAGVICRLAGTGVSAFNGDGRRALATELYLVSAVREGPDGRLWLMDFNNHRLRYVDDAGKIRTAVGNGLHDFAIPDAPAVESPLENPIDFAFDAEGRTVFVSYHDPRVLRVDAQGVLRVVAGTGELGIGGDGGPALDATFLQLTGIAVGPDGTTYVADDMAHRVRAIRPDGTVALVAGTRAGYEGDGGPATEARIDEPQHMAVAPDGTLYIADAGNHTIRRVRPDGIIETAAGTGEAGDSGDGGPATRARLRGPMGVALDVDGTLYVADARNHRIRRVRPDGIIDTVAGTGEAGNSGDGGPGSSATLDHPSGLSLRGRELLIADQGNHCVRVLYLGE